MVGAVWRIAPSSGYRTGFVTLLIAGSLSLCVHDWGTKTAVRYGGLRAVVDRIRDESAGGETIVVGHFEHYFPVKFYSANRPRVRLLEPETELLWGNHLIREPDLIRRNELMDQLSVGIWIVTNSSRVEARLLRAGAVRATEFEAVYVHESRPVSLRISRWIAQ
jgi:hypothetical protein